MSETAPDVMRGRTMALARPDEQQATGMMTRDLESQFKIAAAVANAGDAVPSAYRGKPGAVLLAIGWSQAHGVDLLTAVQNVAFINGRPTVDASMQRALAKRHGLNPKIVEASPTSATVELWDGSELIGSATYTMENAKTANLASKDNWKKNPEDMLVARATTRCMRRHAPEVLLGVFSEDELDEFGADDVTDVVAEAPPAEPPAETPPPEPEIVDAEVVDEPPAPAEPAPRTENATASEGWRWSTRDELAAEIKSRGLAQAAVVQQAQQLASPQDPMPVNLSALLEAPDSLKTAIAAWIDAGGES